MSRRQRPGHDRWAEALASLDRCPFVGPRPQTKDDLGMLIGRRHDLSRVERAVFDRPMAILDGYSGSGKTSLLQNGLFDRLREAGYVVLVARKWGVPDAIPPLREEADETREHEDAAELEVERFLAKAIRETLTDLKGSGALDANGFDLDKLALDGGLGAELARAFEGTAVLILDQFEELLRHSERDTARRIVKWLMTGGQWHGLRVLLSLRSDSMHLLDPLLRGARPFSLDRISLDEITDPETIRLVLRTTLPEKGEVLSADAVERMMELWDRFRPSLLHLQATLYALYFRCSAAQHAGSGAGVSGRPEGGRAASVLIDVEAVDRLAQEARVERLEDPFDFGLHESIRLKVDHATEAARSVGVDAYLVTGTREMVRRAAPNLSSGEFKVPIAVNTLAQRVLVRELSVLGEALRDEVGGAEVNQAFLEEQVRRLLDKHRESADLLNSRYRDGEYLNSSRWREVTAGPMLGATASETLFEELRRVTFAERWLRTMELARVDPDGHLVLVHDKMGPALNAWAAKEGGGPDFALHQLTGARGEHFVWRNPPWIIEGDDRRFRVVTNVNWRDCHVSATFRHVVFANCDFSGVRFDGCTFEGVTFVNCMLDNTRFERCRVVGDAVLKPIVRSEDVASGLARLAPSFIIDAAGAASEAFCHYRAPLEPSGGCATFFSDTAGTPALPGGPPPDHGGEIIGRLRIEERSDSPEAASWRPGQAPVDLYPALGGVALLGGRVCFLSLYRCQADEEMGGSFALHHVSGSGLDIVDPIGIQVCVFDGALRGVAATCDNTQTERAGAGDGERTLQLSVSASLVADVYFANDLRGSANFTGSMVLMVLNAAHNGPEGFNVSMDNCRYQFIANTDEPTHSTEDSSIVEADRRYFLPVQGTASRFTLPNRPNLAVDMEAMDFRFRPEAWEKLQRRPTTKRRRDR